ncbi:MAG: phosphoglucosamine mutase [Firmicutes bacterium]|nr:phosphoglucosamine mutase [Bacillota bacterium]
MSRLFGTDGIRGIANTELDAELAYRVARAATYFLVKNGPASETGGVPAAGAGPAGGGVTPVRPGQPASRPGIIVGRDTRASGDLLEAAVVAGICSSGADALRAGVMTTPGVAYLSRLPGIAGGFMISASHNPAEYNGIKVFNVNGFKLPDPVEEEIETLVLGPAGLSDVVRAASGPACGTAAGASDRLPRPTKGDVGRARVLSKDESTEMYMGFLMSVAEESAHRSPAGRDLGAAPLEGLKVVLDCANGSASAIAPEVFRRLGAQVVAVCDSPDGLNINVKCGSTYPATLCEAVRRNQADVGFAYDGDADRCIASDEKGNVVDGDQILAICGLDMASRGVLKDNTVVATVLSNLGLEVALRRSGVSVKRTRVGDRYVLEEMLASGYNLGGEQSGHIIFLNHSTTGDGILTSLKVASIIKASARKFSSAAAMTKYPQVMVNVKVAGAIGSLSERLSSASGVQAVIARAEKALGETGRVVVRPSGTEPLIRVMVETDDAGRALQIAEEIGEVISREFGA